MEFTEYKMDLKRIRAKLRTIKRTLKARRGTTDLVRYGLAVIRARLLVDPACYLTYGPYWWAMKDMLIRRGYSFGMLHAGNPPLHAERQGRRGLCARGSRYGSPDPARYRTDLVFWVFGRGSGPNEARDTRPFLNRAPELSKPSNAAWREHYHPNRFSTWN